MSMDRQGCLPSSALDKLKVLKSQVTRALQLNWFAFLVFIKFYMKCFTGVKCDKITRMPFSHLELSNWIYHTQGEGKKHFRIIKA